MSRASFAPAKMHNRSSAEATSRGTIAKRTARVLFMHVMKASVTVTRLLAWPVTSIKTGLGNCSSICSTSSCEYTMAKLFRFKELVQRTCEPRMLIVIGSRFRLAAQGIGNPLAARISLDSRVQRGREHTCCNLPDPGTQDHVQASFRVTL